MADEYLDKNGVQYLWNKIKEYINDHSGSSSLIVKTKTVTGTTNAGGNINTGLDSTKTLILGVDCGLKQWNTLIQNNIYFLNISEFKHIGNNLYAISSDVNTSITLTIYYIEI